MRFGRSFVIFGRDFFVLRELHLPRALYAQREDESFVFGLGRIRVIVSPLM